MRRGLRLAWQRPLIPRNVLLLFNFSIFSYRRKGKLTGLFHSHCGSWFNAGTQRTWLRFGKQSLSKSLKEREGKERKGRGTVPCLFRYKLLLSSALRLWVSESVGMYSEYPCHCRGCHCKPTRSVEGRTDAATDGYTVIYGVLNYVLCIIIIHSNSNSNSSGFSRSTVRSYVTL